LLCGVSAASSGVTSIDARTHTITKVRTAVLAGKSRIIAGSYDGAILAIGYDGKVRWTNSLSGFMNHDIWCADITGDGADEILAANADGSIYCLDPAGKLLWTFKANNAPMYSVCVVKKEAKRYIACGGYDKNLYYLSNSGKLVKKIRSNTYSREKSWGKGPKRIPPKGVHSINFMRPARGAGGRDLLVVHGVMHGMSSTGSLYFFPPLSDKPSRVVKLPGKKPFGEMRVCDANGDGVDELLMGASSMINDSALAVVGLASGKPQLWTVSQQASIRRKIDRFGYRVLQPLLVRDGRDDKIMLLFGSRIILLDKDIEKTAKPEVLACRYSFNDVWVDPITKKIILAGSQSGGSCVHVLDLTDPGWKAAYKTLSPPGKIASIIRNTETVRRQLADFKKPSGQRKTPPVYFMTESIPDSLKGLVAEITRKQSGPVFLKGQFMPHVENWNRSGMANEKYRNRRDRRKKYTRTGDQIVDLLKPHLADRPGVAYWGGHGNDPYMISLATQKRIIDAAGGKKVVMIYPELEDPSEDFGFVLDDLIFPLAEYCRGKNANLYIRCKHLFWQSSIYSPMWSRLVSGEFSDVFVPSMEETSDKTMELSIAARMGLWAGGSVDDWGARCARDNPSFDRLRQHSHQMLPNHFLRAQIYRIASGATYLNNFPVDQEYMSLLWSLIARGALYVPKRSEIVSISPVHLSIIKPDKRYADDGNNVKWTVFYDEKAESNDPFVFSRMNGSWPGAPVTRWDFSRYAAGVKDRRLNFLPPYSNGMVLITPRQKGRKATLKSTLHPLYGNILKEYVTDGRWYYSPDGRKQAADTYYKTIEKDIAESASKIPLTVSGNVAWVAAMSAPGRIRLALIDSGYLNPQAKTAIVTFNTVTPLGVTDILSKEKIAVDSEKTARVKIPCGSFRFIDIEIKEKL